MQFFEITDGGACYVVEVGPARSRFEEVVVAAVGDDRYIPISWNDDDLK